MVMGIDLKWPFGQAGQNGQFWTVLIYDNFVKLYIILYYIKLLYTTN